MKKAAAVKLKLLGEIPPEINQVEEEKLSRLERTRLAQLRSGYCPLLNSYLSPIDEEIQNSCTLCNNEEHTVKHHFECPKNTTSLKIADLWNNPNEAVNFLNSGDIERYSVSQRQTRVSCSGR